MASVDRVTTETNIIFLPFTCLNQASRSNTRSVSEAPNPTSASVGYMSMLGSQGNVLLGKEVAISNW